MEITSGRGGECEADTSLPHCLAHRSLQVSHPHWQINAIYCLFLRQVKRRAGESRSKRSLTEVTLKTPPSSSTCTQFPAYSPLTIPLAWKEYISSWKPTEQNSQKLIHRYPKSCIKSIKVNKCSKVLCSPVHSLPKCLIYSRTPKLYSFKALGPKQNRDITCHRSSWSVERLWNMRITRGWHH